MMKRILSAAILAMSLLIASPVAAQSDNRICVSHDDWAKSLRMGYQENVVAAGMTADGIFLEVFSSPDGETWSIFITYPAGLTCAMASGKGWSTITPSPDEPTDEGDPI